MATDMHADYLNTILTRYGHSANNLLQILREVQEHSGYVDSEAISHLSSKLRIPRARIESVASFYSFLHLKPHGAYRVLFSDNITDRMLGSQVLMERMCQQLWLQPGKVSEDQFSGSVQLVPSPPLSHVTSDKSERSSSCSSSNLRLRLAAREAPRRLC